jgi:glutamate dehydrogenase
MANSAGSGVGSRDPAAAAFDGSFVAHIAEEDAAAYDPAALDAAAELARAALLHHRKGHSIVSVAADSGIRREGRIVSVITLVNDDMPFLFDSIAGEVTASCGAPYLVAHPVFAVKHGAGGVETVRGLAERRETEFDRISVMQFHVRRMDDEAAEALQERLSTLLTQLRQAVTGWRAMIGRLNLALSDLAQPDVPLPSEKASEAIAFLEWLRDDNFTFLGMREFAYEPGGDLRLSDAPALGILSDPNVRVLRAIDGAAHVTPEIRAFLEGPEPLIVTKANTKSSIHRRAYMDYVGVKLYAGGRVSGELRIVGLFTATAYTRSVLRIPWLSAKVLSVVDALGYDPHGHSGKALTHILETYPRDELFQIDAETLKTNAAAILSLYERPRVRALVRRDPFDRFVSVIVYVPRDRYDSQAREAIAAYLKDAFAGRLSAFYPDFPHASLARVHFIIGRSGGPTPAISQRELEVSIRAIVRTWDDALADAVEDAGPEDAVVKVVHGLPKAYRASFAPEAGLADAARIAALSATNPVAVDFYRRSEDAEHQGALKIFAVGSPVTLSRRVPLLENMGFRVISERTFETEREPLAFIHDMEIERADGKPLDLAGEGIELERTFVTAWRGDADNDGYNGLTLSAGLDARSIRVVRALGRYLQQAGIPQSQEFVAATLNRHPAIARMLHAMFAARFDPALPEAERKTSFDAARDGVLAGLDAVTSLDDDTILRRLEQLVASLVRTNHFADETDGARQSLAFKIAASELDFLPKPRPWREIFVYGPEVEGVHLRFGPVARGGLRWSDRALDYRTEVLGLVKAQQVKNAVIVPVGAKGGFFPKRIPAGATRDVVQAGGVKAYINFVTSLLSLTDTIVDGKVQPPRNVVRLDGDDPYFVVAADKGTATFSDTANGIAQARGFWLDDAFASGGSAGYDHKKMGITARGAWEAVKRHFREMDRDIQREPFTAVGVGDMSGDVFGNGMLLSRQTKLVAAFDHRDIFIDPDPDPATSFAERERLFALPRSSWQDYDKGKLSKGGGIFPRSLKSITLSAEAGAALGLATLTMTPADLMTAILKAPVDLMWFGGIGTYARGSTESDAEVGDRANDAVRVTGADVRAKVVGEGANLGMTARARVEYALNGGRCNSDAIDNSGGVNSSDVEVNVKIAFAPVLASGQLKRADRDRLLASMTDQVAGLVLANNYDQTLALSLVERRARDEFADQRRFMAWLETRGLLDRAVEKLPTDAQLDERAARGQALTRPELAILLAYAKLALADDVAAGALADDPYLAAELSAYFPEPMRSPYAAEISAHRLRREIIRARLVNDSVNRGGPQFIWRLQDATGRDASAVLSAYVVARDGFGCGALFGAIDALDATIPGAAQLKLYEVVVRFLADAAGWQLRHRADADIGKGVQAVQDALGTLEPRLSSMLPASQREFLAARIGEFATLGAPKALAARLGTLAVLGAIPEIALIGEKSSASVAQAAGAWFAVTDAFRIDRMDEALRSVATPDYFDGLALSRAGDMIGSARRDIAIAALRGGRDRKDPVGAWMDEGGARIAAVRERLRTLSEGADLSVSRLTVAAGLLGDLAGR